MTHDYDHLYSYEVKSCHVCHGAWPQETYDECQQAMHKCDIMLLSFVLQFSSVANA